MPVPPGYRVKVDSGYFIWQNLTAVYIFAKKWVCLFITWAHYPEQNCRSLWMWPFKSKICMVHLSWLLTQMEAQSSSGLVLSRKRRRESSTRDSEEGERLGKYPKCTVVSQRCCWATCLSSCFWKMLDMCKPTWMFYVLSIIAWVTFLCRTVFMLCDMCVSVFLFFIIG